jgi:hypothetical protein
MQIFLLKLLQIRFLIIPLDRDTMENSLVPASRTRQPLEVSQPNSVQLLRMKSSRTATLASYQGPNFRTLWEGCRFLQKMRLKMTLIG